MNILVLGSGLLGVSTAYVLASRGHEVEIIDRNDVSGAETSYANGGQLSYSHGEPWASPGTLMKLPKWLLDPSSPLIFQPRLDWPMIKWGLQFLLQCTPTNMEKNTINLLRLGLYSHEKMTDFLRDVPLEIDYAQNGILNVYGSEKSLQAGIRQSDFQSKFGGHDKILSKAEVLSLEPALQHTERDIAGAIYCPIDASADAQKYCVQMAQYCQDKLGVIQHAGEVVERIESQHGKIIAVHTKQKKFTADAYVVALGCYSVPLLAPLGIHLPIYPMKGYSLTIKATEHSNRISLADDPNKIVFTRLGDRLRVAGTAEFAGYDTDVRQKRLEPILKACRSFMPQENWEDRLHEWGCIRPSTPEGPPVLGRTPYANLYLNTGHGTLGWTQAAGSATLVADIMEERPTEITLGGLTLRSR